MNPPGKAVLYENKGEGAHYRRRYPPLQEVRVYATLPPTIENTTSLYSEAQALLKNCLALRLWLLESFIQIEARCYPWLARPGESEAWMASLHDGGVYIYRELRGWAPRPRADMTRCSHFRSRRPSHLMSRQSPRTSQALKVIQTQTWKLPLPPFHPHQGCIRTNHLGNEVSVSGSQWRLPVKAKELCSLPYTVSSPPRRKSVCNIASHE